MRKEESDSAPPTYEVAVLGCKVNQYEAQQIRRRLDLSDLRPAQNGEKAGVVVVDRAEPVSRSPWIFTC